MTIRLVLADPSDLVLLGIQSALRNHLVFDLVSSLRSTEDLLATVREIQPDIVLVNERLDPLIDILALVERLKHVSLRSRLIVLGTHMDGLLIRDLFACGVMGYLYSGDDLHSCLIQALKMVFTNRPYLSPTANAEYLITMQTPLRDWKLDSESRTVLRLLARGLHISEIAKQMDTTLRRIYWIRQKLRTRFGANTNEHLIIIAVSEGFAHDNV